MTLIFRVGDIFFLPRQKRNGWIPAVTFFLFCLACGACFMNKIPVYYNTASAFFLRSHLGGRKTGTWLGKCQTWTSGFFFFFFFFNGFLPNIYRGLVPAFWLFISSSGLRSTPLGTWPKRISILATSFKIQRASIRPRNNPRARNIACYPARQCAYGSLVAILSTFVSGHHI